MSYNEVLGGRAPIRMWADPAEVEPNVMQQLRNVANLPWVQGRRGDAGRPLRDGRDGGFGHRDAGRGVARRRSGWTSAAG